MKHTNTAAKTSDFLDGETADSLAPGQPVSGARGKFGEYMDFSPAPPLPRNFAERFTTAFVEGSSFAEQAVGMTNAEVHENGKMRLGDHGFRLRFRRYGTAWDDIYGAAFWFAASFQSAELGVLYDLSHTHAALCGARCQRNLARALVSVTEEERKRVSSSVDCICTNPTASLTWGRNFKGAMSVARVAHALKALGQSVVLPSIHVDMLYKIDLFVELVGKPAKFLCLQIKGKQDERSTSALLTDEAMDGRSYSDLQLETKNGVNWFAERYRVTCLPAIVLVGRNLTPWDIETHYTLDLTLQNLLSLATE